MRLRFENHPNHGWKSWSLNMGISPTMLCTKMRSFNDFEDEHGDWVNIQCNLHGIWWIRLNSCDIFGHLVWIEGTSEERLFFTGNFHANSRWMWSHHPSPGAVGNWITWMSQWLEYGRIVFCWYHGMIVYYNWSIDQQKSHLQSCFSMNRRIHHVTWNQHGNPWPASKQRCESSLGPGRPCVLTRIGLSRLIPNNTLKKSKELRRSYSVVFNTLTLRKFNIAFENGHRNSELFH